MHSNWLRSASRRGESLSENRLWSRWRSSLTEMANRLQQQRDWSNRGEPVRSGERRVRLSGPWQV